jgi:uncharacterized protein YjlB
VAGAPNPMVLRFGDGGAIPNHPRWPLLVYKNVLALAGARDPAAVAEELFSRHGWRPAWRWSVYPFPHYHATAHEVLGVYRGSASLRLGHTVGVTLAVGAGDVLVIPAGVGHQNLGSSDDFHVVGGYPRGQHADLRRGAPGERPEADERIARVPRPATDPVHGPAGPLTVLWAE